MFQDEVLYANSPDNRKMPSDLENFRFNSPFPDEFVETSTLQQSCDEYAIYEEETEHPFQEGTLTSLKSDPWSVPSFSGRRYYFEDAPEKSEDALRSLFTCVRRCLPCLPSECS